MKKLFYSLAIVLFLSGNAFAVSAEVGYITDGDTFAAMVKLEDDIKISVRVRILDIDAPEMSGECDAEIEMAVRAKDRLAELIPVGSVVELRDIKDDKYLGRIDARVTSADGVDVSKTLIKEKLARKYGGERRKTWCGANGEFVY